MLNRHRLSTVLFAISMIIVMYCVWFQVKFTLELMALSWVLLATSRSLLLFPNLLGHKADIKLGKEILTDKEIKQ